MARQPLYKILKEYIKKHIENGTYKPQEAIPSENELCKQFDTSRVTVRKAIDELVLENYLYRLQGLGTYVQESHKRQPVDTGNRIDIIFHDNNFLFSEFNSSIIQGAERVLSQGGLTLATYYAMNQVDNQYNKIRNAIAEGAKGIILCGCLEEEEETLLKDFVQSGVPIVCIDRYFPSLPFDAVIGNDFAAGYEAGKLFIEKGYRKIGFYYPYSIESSVSKGRLGGLIKAMEEQGIPVDDSLLMGHTDTQKDNMYDYDYISRDISRYLKDHKSLEAVVAHNDITALLFYKEASKLGIKIPHDLALISFGNFYIDSIFEVGLTSFDQHPDKMGEEAAKLIMHKLINPAQQGHKLITVDYDLIRRNSCG